MAKQILATIMEKKKDKNWTKHLPELALTYNNSHSNKRQLSPYEMVFHMKLHDPHWSRPEVRNCKTIDELRDVLGQSPGFVAKMKKMGVARVSFV